MRLLFRRVAAPVVVATLVACGGGAARPAATTISAIGPPTLAGLLASHLITTVPSGYVQEPDAAGQSGPLDLAAAIANDGGQDAPSALHGLGFAGGYARAWQTADHRQIRIVLYQFGTPAGASAYARRATDRARAQGGGAMTPFALAAVPGAVGLSAASGSTYGSFAFFSAGDDAVQIGADAPDPNGLTALVTQVATAQHARL